jgi:hypothetical protein
MGYLNKETVTVDAILTKRGRELLAQGRSAFNITQFAVADDEIDYGLYNPAHPLGTEFYGSAIENMPIVEASPDDTQNLKSKLVTFDRAIIAQINVIPTVQLPGSPGSITLTQINPTSGIITPSTRAGQQATFDGPDVGYTAVLYDSSAATIRTNTAIQGGSNSVPTAPAPDGAQVVTGLSFVIDWKQVNTITRTVVVFIGNQTGATFTLPVIIEPPTS